MSSLATKGAAFFASLDHWMATLMEQQLDPATTAIIVVDMVEGFCHHGNLASPRVAALVEPIRELLTAYVAAGGEHVLIAEDTHEPDSREFAAFGSHCIRGSGEEQTVDALRDVDRDGTFVYFPKSTINVLLEPAFGRRLREALDGGVTACLIVGDCTDLCVHQAAMGIQVWLNQPAERAHESVRVIVPASAVDTYDLPVETAATLGVLPHDAEVLHAIFLYHLALNGVTVCRSTRWTAA